MEMSRRNALIYGLLLALWALVIGWQTAEHFRVQRTARVALGNRARDISTTLGTVLRAQRRFGGIISKERIESALAELLKLGDITGIALLSSAGTVVASAGELTESHTEHITGPAEYWDTHTVTLMNLVDLGTNLTRDIEGSTPPIIIPRDDLFRHGETNRPSARPPPPRPPPPEIPTNFSASLTITSMPSFSPGRRWPFFSRPRWMSDDEYQAIIQKQGVHSFHIVMSTAVVKATCAQDLWLRLIICLFATAAAAGAGLAWRTFAKTAELQLRLVRASELTTHLREMNLAAAGLAHETRNPLNIIRGLAQMISKRPDVPAELQTKSRDIIDETDRVTAQLNEFINYSRPREVRRSTLALSPLVSEVVRALSADLEEKTIRLQPTDVALTIEADEQMLRQALFNLLLNAVQAVDPGGEIQIVAEKHDAGHAFLEVRDNGPGVPPDRRTEIFKPYVTSTAKGTGLGLAVVQQIVLAHSWEVECLPNEPRGARFRISHLRLVS